MRGVVRPRGRLFRKYVVLFASVVSAALLTSGLVELYFSYRENLAALVALQREQAAGAAAKIEAFVRDIERQVGWASQGQVGARQTVEQRRFEFIRLQRQAPAITEVSQLDSAGREQLRVSRLAMDVVGSQTDFSTDPRFKQARPGRPYFGPVYLRKESEPYLTLSVAADNGVTTAEVNLKFIWDVVSQIRIGTTGRAYVVDGRGQLVAHPDISLVLQNTNLSRLVQVEAVLAPPGSERREVTVAQDSAGNQVLTASAPISPLGWWVFAEQPLGEALAPLYASAYRTVALLLAGVAFSVLASLLLARRIATPIQALEAGAARFGAGALDQRIDVKTGDELEGLADQFNRMAGQLQESYTTLEQKVEDRTRELSEALEQQTATAEVLRVISSSPTDIQPVLDTVAERAARLCEAVDAVVLRVEGESMRTVAHHGPIYAPQGDLMRAVTASGLIAMPFAIGSSPQKITREWASGRAVLDRRTIHIPDLAAEAGEFPVGAAYARQFGHRTTLVTPLLREDVPLGALMVRRNEVRPFTDKQVKLLETFAAQAVIAIENVRLFQELDQRNHELSEALEQQTATGEILRVISSSPTDIQPVFDAVAANAARLCAVDDVTIHRIEDGGLRRVAHVGSVPVLADSRLPLLRGGVNERVLSERRTVHVPDTHAAAFAGQFPGSQHAAMGIRSLLATPLVRDGAAIGLIQLRRSEPRPFTAKQIALLETFAAQAVIAIENVRLFQELDQRNHELSEALEQQTATGDILRVISSSPTDVQPTFEAIAASAVRLCEAEQGTVFRFDGRLIHLVARHGGGPRELEALQRVYPRPPGQGTITGRAILTGAVVQADIRTDPDHEFVEQLAELFRIVLSVPMVRDGAPIGAISVNRREDRPFSAKQIALLETFAAQAVIAIENVRLFQELDQRNRELTDALEQQTATAEILRVISSSPTDLGPVFDTILDKACALSEAQIGAVLRLEGDEFEAVASRGVRPEFGALLRSQRFRIGRPMFRPDGPWHPVHIEDVTTTALMGEPMLKEIVRIEGIRTVLGVPLVREGRMVGSIMMYRREVRPFTDKQIDLVSTFATQAVIAIQNARLFQELQARTQDLARSVEQLQALGAVGQAVSSTLDIETVLTTIVSRADLLAGADGGAIYEYDEARKVFHLRATQRLGDEFVSATSSEPIRLGEGALGRAAQTRQPAEIPDVLAAGAYEGRMREIVGRTDFRAVLAVPLLREGRILGGLVVLRKTPGAFAPEVVDLLKTLAAQSAIAIQNARLFQALEDKSQELEAASRHKSEFLANMSHELRTPLNAIIGFSEVLGERMFGELNEKQAEYVQDILSSGRHLLALINDILDLSKVEAGRMELELSRFDLPAAIGGAVILVRERATRHGLALEVSVDDRLGPFVGDERKIRQVLLNLLSNAVKFTPEGGRIGVRAGPADGAVEISVSDTGIGIAPEDQEAIFQEFRQVGTDYARKREGTGLGLALARRFVDLHGGRIWVKSRLGEGSTFTFTVPGRPWPAS